MYDHRLQTKNELVRQMDERIVQGVDKIEDIKKQFYIGTKTYMKKNHDEVKYFNLPEGQQTEVLTKVFQAFDTLESTEEMKQQINRIVQKRLDDIKKSNVNVNKWELNYNIFENLIERRAENNHDLYRVFFLKYLTPHMREIVWRGVLQDGVKVREYEFNVKKEKIFTISRDDIYILQTCQQVLRQNFHPLGDDSYDQLMVFKGVMIYAQAHLQKTVMSENYFYLMIPILCSFRNFQTKTREKYLVSFFITFLEQTYSKAVPKLYDRDEREYEIFIRNLTQGVQAICDSVDPEIGKRLKGLLSFEDDEISTYYMDLMLNVRRGEITHIPNADLTLTKQQVIFGELLRNYVEKMSVGFINVKATMTLWDAILLKQVKDPSDILISFTLILVHYKMDFLRCMNILQVVAMFKEKAPLMHEYDFYDLFFNYFKEKDLSNAFDAPEIGQNRTCFPHLQDVIAGSLQKKIEKESSMVRGGGMGTKRQGSMLFNDQMSGGGGTPMDDEKNRTNYSGMSGGTNYSGQRPGRMGHMIENNDQMKQFASKLIGKVNLTDMEKDILRQYQ